VQFGDMPLSLSLSIYIYIYIYIFIYLYLFIGDDGYVVPKRVQTLNEMLGFSKPEGCGEQMTINYSKLADPSMP